MVCFSFKESMSCGLNNLTSLTARKRAQRENKHRISFRRGFNGKYKIVKGLTGNGDGVSFESWNKSGYYLRQRGHKLIVDNYEDSESFRKNGTFLPLTDFWYTGYFAFESLADPGYFIRREDDDLKLQKYDGSKFFKEDASFRLTRKRCVSCIRVGSRVWVKVEVGGYLRGRIFKLDEEVHVELEDNGKKIKHHRKTPEAFVPDVIPRSHEIEIGTRVLAQWYNRRDSYYPGIVVGIKGTYYRVIYDDGDKGYNELTELRVVKPPEFGTDTRVGPSWSSLDDLPRIGGLCLSDNNTYGNAATEGEGSDREDSVNSSREDSGRCETPVYSNSTERSPTPNLSVSDYSSSSDSGYQGYRKQRNSKSCLTPNCRANGHCPTGTRTQGTDYREYPEQFLTISPSPRHYQSRSAPSSPRLPRHMHGGTRHLEDSAIAAKRLAQGVQGPRHHPTQPTNNGKIGML